MNAVGSFGWFVVGRDGLTHNMLNDIHNNWKSCEAVRVKCLGVPTVDMQNVCHQLEVASSLPKKHSTLIFSCNDSVFNKHFRSFLFDVTCHSI